MKQLGLQQPSQPVKVQLHFNFMLLVFSMVQLNNFYFKEYEPTIKILLLAHIRAW